MTAGLSATVLLVALGLTEAATFAVVIGGLVAVTTASGVPRQNRSRT